MRDNDMAYVRNLTDEEMTAQLQRGEENKSESEPHLSDVDPDDDAELTR